MTVCFHDDAGRMYGVDKHLYWTAAKIPIPDHPHMVVLPLFAQPSFLSKRAGTVTSESWKMIQAGHKNMQFVHVPVPVPPDPQLEALNLAVIITLSKSGPVFSVGSVTGEGTALAVCAIHAFGYNNNCRGDGIAPNGNSVVTSPTLGDYASGALGVAVGRWLKKVIPNPVVRWVVDKVLIKPYVLPWVQNKLKEFVDGLD